MRLLSVVGGMMLGLAGSTLGAAGPAAEASFVARLSPAEFAAAGLAKLTPAERAELDRLISSATAGEVAEVRATVAPPRAGPPSPVGGVAASASVPASARVSREPAPRAVRIASRLRGTFTGWTGATVFELENGQRWLQIDGGAYKAFPTREAPAVEVLPAAMGSYFLKVEGVGTRCRVRLLSD